MKKIIRSTILILCVVMAACTGDNKYDARMLDGVVWGTTYHITYNAAGTDANVADSVVAAMDRVGMLANAYDPTSEIARLNAHGRLDNASDNFRTLVEDSRRLSAMTEGFFDPTVGPIVDLWGFGAGSDPADTISDIEVARRLALTGLDGVIVTDNAVILQRDGARLDFAAFAKGYGVDCVAKAIENAGVTDYLVEIGGEVRAHGTNPRHQLWRIQIDAPIPAHDGSHTLLVVLQLDDVAVATSGNYRNFRRDTNGRLVGHTISPMTGRPAVTDLLSVTIVAKDAMTADAVATAAMVIGHDKAVEMIRRLADDPSTGIIGALLVTTGSDDDSYNVTNIALDGAHSTHIL